MNVRVLRRDRMADAMCEAMRRATSEMSSDLFFRDLAAILGAYGPIRYDVGGGS